MASYRALIRKLVNDLELYKTQIRNLELINVQYQTKLTNFQDKKQALIKLAELDQHDKSNLNKSFCTQELFLFLFLFYLFKIDA